MIAINSFVNYMLYPADNLKIILAVILAISFIFRRSPLASKIYDAFSKIPVKPSLIIILAVSFALRLFWIFWSQHVPPAPISEDILIWTHAKDLVAGYGFRSYWTQQPTAFRPIGYPLVLAGLFKLFGPHLVLAEILQVFLNVLCVFCVFYISKQIVSPQFGLLAALLYGFYPTAIMSTKILLDEHLFLVLWMVSIILLISDFQKPAWSKVIVAGFATGLSAIFRTYSIITCGIAFVVWAVAKRNFAGAVKRGAVIAFLTVLCAVPWGVRNYLRFGAPVLWTTAIGTNMYFANNPTSNVRYPVNPDLEHGGDPGFLTPNLSEIQKDYAGRKAAMNWIKNNPLIFVDKMIGRGFYMMGFDPEGWVIDDNFTNLKSGAQPPSRRTKKFLMKTEQAYYFVAFIFALIGSIIYFIQKKSSGKEEGMIYIIVTVLLYIFATVVALGHRKYKFPIEPFLCILAAYGITQIFFGHVTERMKKSMLS